MNPTNQTQILEPEPQRESASATGRYWRPLSGRRMIAPLVLMGLAAVWILFLAGRFNGGSYRFMGNILNGDFAVAAGQMTNIWVIVTLILIFWRIDRKRLDTVVAMLATLAVCGLTATIIQHVTGRARPEYSFASSPAAMAEIRAYMLDHPDSRVSDQPVDQWLWIGSERPGHGPGDFVAAAGYESFPSGQTTAAFGLATFLSRVYPPLTPVWHIWAAVAGGSSVAHKRQHPGDVLFGAGLGMLLTQWVLSWLWPWRCGEFLARHRRGIDDLFAVSWRAFFGSRGSIGRLTPKRLLVLVVFVPPFIAMQWVHWLGFLLDEALFPRFRNVEVRRPMFIVGVPRSGTTFLHQVLARDDRFTTLKLWELLLAPSISERKFWLALGRLDRAVGGPCRRLIRAIERRAMKGMGDVHPVSLHMPEEDYFFLVPAMACLLLVVPFPQPEQFEEIMFFDERKPAAERRRLMEFYRECVQRHLYVTGPHRRLLSKNPSFSPMVASLAGEFPDGRFICCIRSPLKTVPSLLSSMEKGAAIFGIQAKGRWNGMFLDLLRYEYRHLAAVLPELGPQRHAFIQLRELNADLKGRVTAIYRQFGEEITPRFEAALGEASEQSRRHSSSHSYTLEQYGLTEAQIRAEYAEIFERFGFE